MSCELDNCGFLLLLLFLSRKQDEMRKKSHTRHSRMFMEDVDVRTILCTYHIILSLYQGQFQRPLLHFRDLHSGGERWNIPNGNNNFKMSPNILSVSSLLNFSKLSTTESIGNCGLQISWWRTADVSQARKKSRVERQPENQHLPSLHCNAIIYT